MKFVRNSGEDRRAIKKIEEELKNLNKEIPLNDFQDDVEKIVGKYNLSDNCRESMKGFLLAGCFSPIPRVNLKLWTEEDEKNKAKIRLFIEIYAKTTPKDIRGIWGIVKHLQKGTFGYKEGRNSKKRKFLRDKKIYELYKEGLSYPEISKKIKEEFKERTIMYDEVAKIIQRMKKKIMDK